MGHPLFAKASRHSNVSGERDANARVISRDTDKDWEYDSRWGAHDPEKVRDRERILKGMGYQTRRTSVAGDTVIEKRKD